MARRQSTPKPKPEPAASLELFDALDDVMPELDVPAGGLCDGAGWDLDTWRARERAFVAAFDVEVERTRARWRKAANALREAAAAMEDHLEKAENYGASANTLRRMREEYERDLAEFRFGMWEAQRTGEWLVQCRLVIWLGALAEAIDAERHEREIA